MKTINIFSLISILMILSCSIACSTEYISIDLNKDNSGEITCKVFQSSLGDSRTDLKNILPRIKKKTDARNITFRYANENGPDKYRIFKLSAIFRNPDELEELLNIVSEEFVGGVTNTNDFWLKIYPIEKTSESIVWEYKVTINPRSLVSQSTLIPELKLEITTPANISEYSPHKNNEFIKVKKENNTIEYYMETETEQVHKINLIAKKTLYVPKKAKKKKVVPPKKEKPIIIDKVKKIPKENVTNIIDNSSTINNEITKKDNNLNEDNIRPKPFSFRELILLLTAITSLVTAILVLLKKKKEKN